MTALVENRHTRQIFKVLGGGEFAGQWQPRPPARLVLQDADGNVCVVDSALHKYRPFPLKDWRDLTEGEISAIIGDVAHNLDARLTMHFGEGNVPTLPINPATNASWWRTEVFCYVRSTLDELRDGKETEGAYSTRLLTFLLKHIPDTAAATVAHKLVLDAHALAKTQLDERARVNLSKMSPDEIWQLVLSTNPK